MKTFQTLCQLNTGVFKNAMEARVALKTNGIAVHEDADRFIDSVNFSTQVKEIKLLSATVAELGFERVVRYDEVCSRIQELGHNLCEPEDGLLFSAFYARQPVDEWFLLGMKTLAPYSVRHPRSWIVGRDSRNTWLMVHDGYWDEFGYGCRVVFRA